METRIALTGGSGLPLSNLGVQFMSSHSLDLGMGQVDSFHGLNRRWIEFNEYWSVGAVDALDSDRSSKRWWSCVLSSIA